MRLCIRSSLKDWKRLSSAKGDILEVVKADPVMPPGVFINEDPPFHTVHRTLVSEVEIRTALAEGSGTEPDGATY